MSLLHICTGSTVSLDQKRRQTQEELARSSSRSINRGRRTNVSTGFMLPPKKTRAETKTDPGTGTETTTATVTETEEETEVGQVISAWEIPPHCVRLWSWFCGFVQMNRKAAAAVAPAAVALSAVMGAWGVNARRGKAGPTAWAAVLAAMTPNHPTTDPKVHLWNKYRNYCNHT